MTNIDNGLCNLPARPVPRWLRRLFGRWLPEILLRRWRALGRARCRRAIARDLAALDDRTLCDLGFGRAEITMAAIDLAANRSSRGSQRCAVSAHARRRP